VCRGDNCTVVTILDYLNLDINIYDDVPCDCERRLRVVRGDETNDPLVARVWRGGVRFSVRVPKSEATYTMYPCAGRQPAQPMAFRHPLCIPQQSNSTSSLSYPPGPTACASFLSFSLHTRSTQSLFYCSPSFLTVCRRVTVPRSLPGISQYTPWSRIYLKTTYSCWPYLPDLAAFSVTCKRPDPCFVLQINTPGLAVFNTAADVNCICIVASPAALVSRV
jgi:hypothetical protein